MAKLDKILESMHSFTLNSEVALLESEGIDALTVAQTKKAIYESFGFIKAELIQGGVLQEAQDMLADAWTQAILEDIYMPEDDGMGMGTVAGLGAAGVAGARYLPGAPTAYNHYRQQDQSVGDSLRAAGRHVATGVTGDINAARNMAGQAIDDGTRAIQNGALKADIIGRNAVGQVQDAAKHVKTGYNMGAANEGLTQNIMSNGSTPAKVGAAVGKVVRVIKGFAK